MNKVDKKDVLMYIELHPDQSNYEIARQLGLHESTVRYHKKNFIQEGKLQQNALCPEGYVIKGKSTLYNNEGGITAQWVKTDLKKEEELNLFKEAIEAFKADVPRYNNLSAPLMHETENLLAVYPLGDPHIGMLAWEEECGENWDLKLAEETYAKIFDRVVQSAPNCKEALIVNLGDFFHYDNLAGVTSRNGHSLDTDGRYAKMVRVGVRIIRQMIHSALEKHDTVRIINAIGNHDDTGAMFLSELLYHVYENNARVIVDNTPSPFHYYHFGKVLLGAHHGHTCKKDRLPSVMAADKAKEWGNSNFRYWYTGHIHTETKKEYPGCVVESFRTVAPKDSYATYGGWRSGRDTYCIVIHPELGEIERHRIDILSLTINKEHL